MAVQVSYAIGVAQPLSVFVDTYGTGKIPDKEILAKILDKFDFRPGKCADCWELLSRCSAEKRGSWSSLQV